MIHDLPLLVKREWALRNPGDSRFTVLESGSACAVGWGSTWQLHWHTLEERQVLWQALENHPVQQALVSSGCPGLESLSAAATSPGSRWLGFHRSADHTRLNPDPLRDDKHSTAGYVTTSSDLPPAAVGHYGGPLAGLLSGIGFWHALESGGVTRGWILAAFRGPAGCLLEGLQVLPDWRHKGCATRLVEVAAAGRACCLLAEDRPGTRDFWLGLGFRQIGEYILLKPTVHADFQAPVRA